MVQYYGGTPDSVNRIELNHRYPKLPSQDTIYLDNISNSILVGPNQMQSIYSLLQEVRSASLEHAMTHNN